MGFSEMASARSSMFSATSSSDAAPISTHQPTALPWYSCSRISHSHSQRHLTLHCSVVSLDAAREGGVSARSGVATAHASELEAAVDGAPQDVIAALGGGAP